VQTKIVVYKKEGIGTDDCSRAHRAVMPGLELAFPDQDLYVEVASPGVDRQIKDASEFGIFIGRGVRCYRTDISDWTAGVIAAADQERLTVRSGTGETVLPYAAIAKARLDYSQEVDT
jgi:ribosome maturation factor RimP